MENKEIKQKLQSRLQQKFDLFMEVEINGATIFLVPVSKDIPQIKDVIYDAQEDILEILFESQSTLNYEKISDAVTYIKDNSDQLVGVKVFGLKHLGKEESHKSIAKIFRNEVTKIKDQENTLQDTQKIIRNNFMKRKLSFFNDVLRREYDELLAV